MINAMIILFFGNILVKITHMKDKKHKEQQKDNCIVPCPHCNNPVYINVDVIVGEEHELILDPDEFEFMDGDCFTLEPKHNMPIYTYTCKDDIYVSCEKCNITWGVKPLQKTFADYDDMISYVIEIVRDTLREQ